MHTRLALSMSLNPQREPHFTSPVSLFFCNYLGPHWRRGAHVPFGHVTALNLSAQRPRQVRQLQLQFVLSLGLQLSQRQGGRLLWSLPGLGRVRIGGGNIE